MMPKENKSELKLSKVESLDREIAFYRKRAGQVFFLGLLVEGLILAGREKIVVPKTPLWMKPLTYGIFFIAVAVIGSLLGSEYRKRIHHLKEKRIRLDADHEIYPKTGGIVLSEIQVLYLVLIFLSSCGSMIVWFNAIPSFDAIPNFSSILNFDAFSNEREFSLTFWRMFYSFVALGFCGAFYTICMIGKWMLKMVLDFSKIRLFLKNLVR